MIHGTAELIRGTAELRDAYRDERVVQSYVAERFVQPLGALLHHRQVRALRRVIARHRPQRVLEIAPGPARLTAALAADLPRGAMVVDASLPMLRAARERLDSTGDGFRFISGDAFFLPFRPGFDLIYMFRLIRHFDPVDRARLYREVARLLRPGGLLVFDAINEVVSAPLRAAARPGECRHYDALLRPDIIRDELAAARLELTALDGVQYRYGLLSALQTLVAPRSRTLARAAMEVVERSGGEPLEWVVTCRRA